MLFSMSMIASDNLMIRCTDGKVRQCPEGLVDELERAFGPAPLPMTGPIVSYPNGVKIRIQDEAMMPIGKLVNMAEVPHIVLSGPDPDKENVPPFVIGKIGDSRKELPHGIVEIYDTNIYIMADYEKRPWRICWPGFTVVDGRRLVEALLTLLDKPAYVSFKDMQHGRWLLKKARNSDPLKNIWPTKNKRLKGSKYPWAELQPYSPVYIDSRNLSALHGNFKSWANRRRIDWGIKLKNVAGGVEVIRIPIEDRKPRVVFRGKY
jgi:hypothetical protein